MKSISKWEVVNIVLKGRAGSSIDLPSLAERIGGEYRHKRFPGLIVKRDGVTYLFFRNGKIVVVGASPSLDGGIESLREKIRKYLGLRKKPRLDVYNVVVSLEFRGRISLLRLYRFLENMEDELGIRVVYDPEIFPALVLRMGDSVAFLLFYTGKGIGTGFKNLDKVKETIMWLDDVIVSSGALL